MVGADSTSTSVGIERWVLGRAMMLTPWRDADRGQREVGVALRSRRPVGHRPRSTFTCPTASISSRGVDGDERVVTGQATHVVGDFDTLDHATLISSSSRVGSGEVGAPRRAEEQLAGVEVEDGVAHQS